MSLTLEALENIYCENILIAISEENLKQALEESKIYANQTGKNYAYINSLIKNCFTKWMQENLDLGNEIITTNPVQNWTFVNGSSITFKNKKLVLIPSECISLDELIIPQEWVDIPNWAGDYYLPVQVNLEENYLHFWSYISRQTLKEKAEYNATFHNYFVQKKDLISDLDSLWIALDLCEEKGEIESLNTLTESQAQELIKIYSQPSPYSPRLKGNFKEWMSLLNNEIYLQKLYLETQNPIDLRIVTKLSDWLKGIVTKGWQNLDELLIQPKLVPVPMAMNVFQPLVNIEYLFIKSNLSYPENLDSEAKLIYLIENTSKESIRWEAIESLSKINAENPLCGVKKIKDLSEYFPSNKIALMVGFLPKSNNKIAVLLRVYSHNNESTLPPDLCLQILNETDQLIPRGEVIARKQPLDNYIQLFFTAKQGDNFKARITLNEISRIEQFMI